MSKMSYHQLTDGIPAEAENGENLLATVTPLALVRGRFRTQVMNLIEQGEWSEQCFIRFPNGDLLVGRFPQEDTYESLSEIEQATRNENTLNDPIKNAMRSVIELAETWISERETPPGSWKDERDALAIIKHKFGIKEDQANG